MEIQENVALAPLTTLAVGGEARFFARAENIQDVQTAISFAQSRSLKLFILGGGSNVLISDSGWAGLVLQIGILGMNEVHSSDQVRLQVGAGENWDKFVGYCVSRNYAGIECLSGIPGSVGGTPVQNVGAYGQEVSETITSVLVFDKAESSIRELSAADCGFSYRTSIFNVGQRERYIILGITYELKPGGPPSLHYRDLQKLFAQHDGTPTLSEVRDSVLNIRASKGMLIMADDPDSRSAGSFFKNPVLTITQFDELARLAKEKSLLIPSYPALAQQRKISAAWLVENSGFSKGYTRGRAAISRKHALAIVNRGGATASEILVLKDEVQQRVKATWGITLEPEPVLVGFRLGTQ
jgi:UDP-N-acetylmuramate dehydrogenase